MVKNEEVNDGTEGIYELGYLLNPALSEEKLTTFVEDIKSFLSKNGGAVISEEFPKLRDLAYPMFKMISHKKEVFTGAYFGWIKFELNKKTIHLIEKKLKEDDTIVRFLLISTVRENTMISPRRSTLGRGDRPKTERGSIMSEEEIEKTVEALVAE